MKDFIISADWKSYLSPNQHYEYQSSKVSMSNYTKTNTQQTFFTNPADEAILVLKKCLKHRWQLMA